MWWVSLVGEVFDGRLGWWIIGWRLTCVSLMLEFPCLGPACMADCGLGCPELTSPL